MALREDIIASAVTFLQDPSVASAPLDKRIAFLQSKNLTQEEIDAALARAGDTSSSSANYGYQSQQQQPQQPPSRSTPPPPQYGYGYGPYQGGPGYWNQPPQPPPEVPRRDWRDYFIMATVMSGLSYGVYFMAKRYIVPLIAPPTPPQLEQDKASVDESFNRAFALIDQLAADTASIKESEAARKDQLDSALTDIELTVEEMKRSSRRRDDDNRRINDEIRTLQAMIPKAMENQQKATDERLKELNSELKSLKTLISNRMSGAGVAGAAVQRPGSNSSGTINIPTSQNSTGPNGTFARSSVDENAPNAIPTSTADGVVPGSTPDRSNTTSPYSRIGNRSGIPAWQMAASAVPTKKDTGESGTVAEHDSTVPTSPPAS